MSRSLALFLARLSTNEHQNTFVVRLGVTLLLAKFGITGFLADVLGRILRPVLGLLMESGIFFIDLTMDAYKEGKKLAEFKDKATELHDKLQASKKLTEEQKDAYRKEYLRLISLIGNVGNPK